MCIVRLPNMDYLLHHVFDGARGEVDGEADLEDDHLPARRLAQQSIASRVPVSLPRHERDFPHTAMAWALLCEAAACSTRSP